MKKTKILAQEAKPAVLRDLSDTEGYRGLSAEDAALYFHDTFLLFPQENSYGRIATVDVNHANMRTNFHVNFGHDIKMFDLPDVPVDFGFPETGIYNFKKGTVLFYRRSHRQNKKGLCSGTAGVSNTTSMFGRFYNIPTGFLMSQSWRWDALNLNHIFVKGTLSAFDEAVDAVVRLKAFSRAISRNFLVGQGIDSKAPSLWFRHSLIGAIPAKGKIEILNPSFLQEAADYFLPQGVSIDS